MTFTIRKSYRADSEDDAIMSQWPGCEISSMVRMIKRNIYYLLIAGQRSLLAISKVGAQHAICNMRLSGIVAPLPRS
jgi:hypothetical protein